MALPRYEAGPAAPLGDAEALEQMVEVLRLVASIRAPDRSVAVRYTEARQALVSGRLKSFVPPFLTQCVSAFKFHDFINLYAPDVARRIEFVDESFLACSRALGFTRGIDVFREED